MVRLRAELARVRLSLPSLVPTIEFVRLKEVVKPTSSSVLVPPKAQTALLSSKWTWAPGNHGGGEVEFTSRNQHLDFAFGHLPVYRFRGHRSTVARANIFWSAAYGRNIWAESMNQGDLQMGCEVDPGVEAFCEEPVRLKVRLQSRWTRYPADTLIRVSGALWFLEVKPERHMKRDGIAERLEEIGLALSSLGYGFAVVTEREFREPVRRSNVAAIMAEVHRPVADGLAAAVLLALEEGAATAADVQTRTGTTLADLCALARRRMIALGIDGIPLGDATPVTLRAHMPGKRAP